jgi:hypothetical protein
MRSKRLRRLLVGAGAVSALAGLVAGARAAQGSGEEDISTPLPAQAVPAKVPRDAGGGERLLVVVGGAFTTREEAIETNERYVFGDVQGYYVFPATQFAGLTEVLPWQGSWILGTSFRTRDGAEEFTAVADAFDIPAVIVGPVTSVGTLYTGLGQESSPDGTGPLLRPLRPDEIGLLR